MRHFRITTFSVAAMVGFILVGFGVFSQPVQAVFQPPIPHPLEGRDDCLACHATGAAGAPKVPDDHAGRTSDMCQACHFPAAAAPTEMAPSIPHTLEGREECRACHVPATTTEDATATPAPPAAPTPVSHPQAEGDSNTCAECHSSLGSSSAEIVDDWKTSIHAERGVSCADCHGGNPGAEAQADAMSRDAGFTGKPDRTKIPGLCGSCHANVTLMRQYDLPTDQYAKYLESFHGQRLVEGDVKAATCFDCHDGHATRETNDPTASVYRLNVPDLCARCHADSEYMAEYNIPTDQYALYKESVHGIALLDRQDTRAPSCADCHGTHGATPPGFDEVANVCGSCHAATQDYYLKGAHSENNPDAPRCVTCHGRYDVQQPSEEMFLGSEERHCGSCHDPDSEIGMQATNLYQVIVDADQSYKQAEAAVDRARALGMLVAEEEGLLIDARTSLITARAAQHMVDLDVARQETDKSVEISEQARNLAEDAIAENRFRRQAMIIALGVIVLVIFSLVLLRRELHTNRRL